jgi:peptidoglycan/xylan/chitin deacetylase (PgdA/CDA1 family)
MKTALYPFVFVLSFLIACSSRNEQVTELNPAATANPKAETQRSAAVGEKSANSIAAILAKKEVPILCYHHIRNFRPGESATMKNYSVSPASFAEQMKALADSGYETILPSQLYEYLLHDAKLPEKPVMISFDDTDAEQYDIGAPEMNKYNFKGVFFIMTVSINRPGYMSSDQLRRLADSGHVIAAHTWDHHMVTKYTGADFDVQLVKPKQKLETITGKPVEYFAYPFGLWNEAAIPEVEKSGYKLAFILSSKRDSAQPLFTIRRMLVPGTWSAAGMLRSMETTFNKPR